MTSFPCPETSSLAVLLRWRWIMIIGLLALNSALGKKIRSDSFLGPVRRGRREPSAAAQASFLSPGPSSALTPSGDPKDAASVAQTLATKDANPSATSFLQAATETRALDSAADLRQARQHGTSEDEMAASESRSVHWVFTTDCSAFMYNQGNLLLASAARVEQPGKFTWVMYGCSQEEQRDALKKLAHPRATVWHMPKQNLTDPVTGKPYPHFQASNRPLSLAAWWLSEKPQEEQIAIVDPDMMFIRSVRLVDRPAESSKGRLGPWFAQAATPGRGAGAMYAQGCVPGRWSRRQLKKVCKIDLEACREVVRNWEACGRSYSSGPPWIIHRQDVDKVFSSWMDTALRVHRVHKDILAEQVSFAVTQMQVKVSNSLDPFWFLSYPGDPLQPWAAVAASDYEPCSTRKPPPMDNNLPPFWHATATYEVPYLSTPSRRSFALHKDHIHKDLLDCKSPLLQHPPLDALSRYGNRSSFEFQQTWSVCAYTNLINENARAWKAQFCSEPNVKESFNYPSHASSFLDAKGWIARTFRSGGWRDIDYTRPPHD
eukprot:TRINITY_DN14011_c0_g1_i1.p1 TRINITY_DN14011_c0_g1~~TRINITY_DN14011_c0_g1_i1.p1  ORF type:complete len:558 (+),score=61.46 TRINITY_DN14011_c0_g1_i1:42-1676(+)